MIHYYDHLVEILKEENYYETMIKVFIGPKYNLKPNEVNELKNLGYVYSYKDGAEERCRSLSKDFTHYLRELMMLDEKTTIWPILNDAERRLRSIIENTLTAKFGVNWESDLNRIGKSHMLFSPERIGQYRSTFELRQPGDKFEILKNLSFVELKKIINHFWEDGIKAHFPPDIGKRDWLDKLDLLKQARDPLAHANPEYLTDDQIREANMYCREIIEKTTL